MNTDKVIFTSAMVTLGSTAGYSMMPTELGGKGEPPSPKLLIGTSLSFLGLSILGDVAPSLASPLAVVIAFTALTYYGVPILGKVFN